MSSGLSGKIEEYKDNLKKVKNFDEFKNNVSKLPQ
jgi:hypothetical protein